MNVLDMNDGLIGILALLSIGIVFSVVFHLTIKTKWLAILLTAISGTFAFDWLTKAALGQNQPFSPLAFVISLFILSAIAFLIARLFFKSRKID